MKHQIIGLHAVQAALQQGRIKRIYYDAQRRDKRLQSLLQQAKQQGIDLQPLSRRQLDQKNHSTSNHQGIVAEIQLPPTRGEKELDQFLMQLDHDPFLLVLDSVQDPHNLGACFRSAEAAGVDAIITNKDRSAGLNATVFKVASGAADRLPFFQVTNLARTLRHLRQAYQIRLLGTSDRGSISLYQTDLKGAIAIIMGNEQKGLRRLIMESCDQLIAIPMRGQIESLNISAATAVILFEALRQRDLT